MKKRIWRLLLFVAWLIIIIVPFKINSWEPQAKPGFARLVYWAGIFWGSLMGIVSDKVAYKYRDKDNWNNSYIKT